jgi:hypothetical protein
MSCATTKGRIVLPCKNAISGLKNIYIVPFDATELVTTSSTDSGHTVTNLTAITEFYQYSLKNTANVFDEDATSSSDNGTTKYTQVLQATLTKLSAEMQYQIKMLATGYSRIFIEDNGGTIYAMGLGLGAEFVVKSSIGGTLDGFSGYKLTGTANETEPFYVLNSASVTWLKAHISVDNITE